jgi:hypothetical protein
MIKTLFVAIWSCLVMVGAGFGANYVMKMQSAKEAVKTEEAGFETRKTRELNVPIIRDGAVKGYVVVQLNYVVDLAIAKTLPTPPEAFVVDETFQYIYGDDKIDFAHLDRVDIGKMTESLVQRVNTRLRSNVITDMGVAEFNFLVNSEGKGKT